MEGPDFPEYSRRCAGTERAQHLAENGRGKDQIARPMNRSVDFLGSGCMMFGEGGQQSASARAMYRLQAIRTVLPVVPSFGFMQNPFHVFQTSPLPS
jgi:hypothetical protein